MPATTWMIRAGRGAKFSDHFLQSNCVAVGWLGDQVTFPRKSGHPNRGAGAG